MPNYAHVTLIGHLGQDPETRHMPNGDPVVSFSMATSRKRKDQETTTWWRVSLFGRRGETLAQHLRKGDPVLVSGEPMLRPWTDKEGSPRTSLEVVANDFAFIGGKRDSGEERPARAPAHTETPFDDDIPF